LKWFIKFLWTIAALLVGTTLEHIGYWVDENADTVLLWITIFLYVGTLAIFVCGGLWFIEWLGWI